MNFTDILLVIISSAGLLHGTVLAVYLGFYKKKKPISNGLLAFILVFMAFRIGKSVMLNFGNDLEPIFIFTGLAFLLLIGPLLRWYFLAMTKVGFKLSKLYFLELIPFVILFLASFLVTKGWFEKNNKEAIIVFASVLIFIYLHFAFHIFMAYKVWRKVKKKHMPMPQTKSQNAIIYWLKLLIIGFIVIWVSYFLNIIDDTVPYVIGPIVYAIVVYFLSFKAFQLKVIDIDGNVFKNTDETQLFTQISTIISEDKLYLESNLSLTTISKLVHKTTQKTSEVINQYANQNFNDFINSYRIQKAKKILSENKKLTIASIAFDVGFNSLSSFNTAFKKFEGITPSAYRKNSNP